MNMIVIKINNNKNRGNNALPFSLGAFSLGKVSKHHNLGIIHVKFPNAGTSGLLLTLNRISALDCFELYSGTEPYIRYKECNASFAKEKWLCHFPSGRWGSAFRFYLS